MFLLVIIGAPMVWYLWERVNELLSGEIHGQRLLVAVPVLLVFLGFLYFVSRTVNRWEEKGT